MVQINCVGQKKKIMTILTICTILSFTLLHILKKNNSFVQSLLSHRLPRTILHLNTLLYSGILFLHLETSRSYFKSKLDVITGLYYQRPLFITIIAFFLLGVCWFTSLAFKLGFWSALRFFRWRFLRCLTHTARYCSYYKYPIVGLLLGLSLKLSHSGCFDVFFDIASKIFSFLGLCSNSTTVECVAASHSVPLENSLNPCIETFASSQNSCFSSSLNPKKPTLVGSIYSDLVDKGNLGVNKSLSTLPESSLSSRVRCVDTNFLRIFTLDFKPNLCNTTPYRVHSQCSNVSPFGDIFLIYGKEYAIKPAIL